MGVLLRSPSFLRMPTVPFAVFPSDRPIHERFAFCRSSIQTRSNSAEIHEGPGRAGARSLRATVHCPRPSTTPLNRPSQLYPLSTLLLSALLSSIARSCDQAAGSSRPLSAIPDATLIASTLRSSPSAARNPWLLRILRDLLGDAPKKSPFSPCRLNWLRRGSRQSSRSEFSFLVARTHAAPLVCLASAPALGSRLVTRRENIGEIVERTVRGYPCGGPRVALPPCSFSRSSGSWKRVESRNNGHPGFHARIAWMMYGRARETRLPFPADIVRGFTRW